MGTLGCISAPVACGVGMLSWSLRALIHGMMMGGAFGRLLSENSSGRELVLLPFRLVSSFEVHACIPGLWRDGLHPFKPID